jgi:Rab proteins geranylgeranyltransferase component A
MDPRSAVLDEATYDVIIMGTGFTHSVLAGALAKAGQRVLHLDCLPYYSEGMSQDATNV